MRPLVEAVAVRAVDAALHDPRFPPVSERELSSLRVEVSALTPPKRIASWNDIVLGRDGMTLEKNGRFAVFLPQVAPEQGIEALLSAKQVRGGPRRELRRSRLRSRENLRVSTWSAAFLV